MRHDLWFPPEVAAAASSASSFVAWVIRATANDAWRFATPPISTRTMTFVPPVNHSPGT